MTDTPPPPLPPPPFPPKDLEAPPEKPEDTEDPSVVQTADDSSVGTAEEAAATRSPKNRTRSLALGYGSLLALVGIAVLVIVLTVKCPHNKDKQNQTSNSISQQQGWWGGGEDTPPYNGNKLPCNKTKAPTDAATATATEAEELVPEEPVQQQVVETISDEGPIKVTVEEIVDAEEPPPPPPAFELPTSLPFEDVTPVKSFSPDVLNGYDSAEELEADLTAVSKKMLNRVILQNVYNDYYYSQNVWSSSSTSTSSRPRPEVAPVAQEAAVSATTASAKSKTNNQEEDADEADHVKSDENYVYASYGDYLIVWDLQGTQITTVQMPSQWGDNNNNEQAQPSRGGGDWAPPTYINGLLLTPTKVVVMVDGFANNDVDDDGSGDYLYHHQGTQVRIYSKPTTASQEMTLLETQELNGMYRDGRYMEDSQTLHLLTTGDVNAYPHLISPLQMHLMRGRGDSNSMMSASEYIEAATELANTKLIPEFVQGVTRALMVDGELPTLVQINDWATARDDSNKQSVEEIMKGQHHYYSADAPMRSFLQVTSIKTGQDEGETSTLSTAVALTPSSNAQFYASGDHLVLGMVHSQYNETTHHSHEDLFLLHMNVANGNDGTFHSVASLPGHINSPYSLDIQGNDLRVATTEQKWTPMDRVWPLCGENDDDDDGRAGMDECVSDESFNQCFELAINGCEEIVKTGCPYEYTCAQDVDLLEAVSSTSNQIIVFDISTPGEMMERGRVAIGEPHEVITAVRFGETFSYAMTFDQRDPFYVLQLEPEQPPAIAGSLKLDGFSRYLHPLNQEATLLVGIGQNVSGTGLNQMTTGVMITVFDVSEPTQPVALASQMLENSNNIDSFTHAEWDPKAVQYVNGKLVLPVSMYYHTMWEEVGDDEIWFNGNNMDDFVEGEGAAVTRAQEDEPKENFEGFMVFTVGYTGIQESFRINFLNSDETNTCHYCNGGLLSSRSIVFDDGSLMTMHGDSVQSNNLYTGRMNWQMNVTLEGVTKDCCW